MNGSVFIDTNIAIYLLDGNERIADLLEGQTVCLSFITELELLCKPGLTTDNEKSIREFLTQCVVIDFLPSLKDTVIAFRRLYKLKLPDAIVAATAFSLGLPLFTADKAFRRIEDMVVVAVEV